ncbi:MAG: type I restriction enzyme HsdR N-terminal domain-containing protein [Verrucomicrobiae bacterium]|nr:type I restriction enzyme HsdR N-terminal domain-containing protein [Verrucomicrobiae bacterium]
MRRKSFYEVPPATYLFPAMCQTSGDQAQPEEPVRQWCAYELMRAYGAAITELEFEHQVRVGSKTYRIDILVSRNGSPWVVVECKEPRHAKHDAGMKQAISYADAQGVKAEFALYTNGDVWQVQRRVQDQWIPVADLPTQLTEETVLITRLLTTIQEVSPLLGKLDEIIEDKDAQTFLSAMQVFFRGSNLLTEDADRDLLFATDNLLRVLSVAGELPYQLGKLRTVQMYYERYRVRAGFPLEIGPITDRDPVYVEMIHLHAGLMNMVEGTHDLVVCDALLLRVNTALLEYGRNQRDGKAHFPRIGPSLHHALRNFLHYALSVHLNTVLPDTLDHTSIGDMHGCCHEAWEAHKRSS